MDPRNESPFNALPPVVVGLAVVIVGVELLFQAASLGLVGGAQGVGWRLTALGDWSVADPVWQWMWTNRSFPPELLVRFVTYPLLHVNFTHALFVAVFVLAFGNVNSVALPGWRQLAIFFGGAVAGALAFVMLYDARMPLVGGFAGAYAMIGAFTYLTRLGLTPVPPDRAFLLIGFLLALGPIFGFATGAGLSWVPDWTAEVAGAAAGYGIAVLLFPGGIDRLRARLRQR
ncbi:rhomboid family intramembrane serine protease [Jannaschia aquimarina]|uniref:Rhomboid family protein n=1 Tax=Jannaschia aquimarina TaxID=935700 RepID=A0A0D1E988_9RHOB|nr:rhomboid family intramembrane serine protease [Jannaschia aquimarina]KIT14184.1 Rhomboid family protein [Jannaschia aquimarina]SNS47588.1 Rhomboid family protein [Jannaschia aquimarina]